MGLTAGFLVLLALARVSPSTLAVVAANNRSNTYTPEIHLFSQVKYAKMLWQIGHKHNIKPHPSDIELVSNITAPYCPDSSCERTKYHTAVNCFCDESCYFYKDCCYSMIDELMRNNNETSNISELITSKVKEVENQTLMFRKDLISCVGDDNKVDAFFMVSDCDSNIKNIPKHYVEKCFTNKSYNFQNVPVDRVIDNQMFATFANIYCALCNGISLDELEFWKINITCFYTDTAHVINMTLANIAKIKDCSLKPYSAYTQSLRRCSKEDKLSCLSSDISSEIIHMCHSYVYPITDKNIFWFKEREIYRNPHCAACATNTLTFTDFYCTSLSKQTPSSGAGKPGIVPSTSQSLAPHMHGIKPVDLQIFFDFSVENGVVFELKCIQSVVCNIYEVYDCVVKRCNQLYCHVGEIPRNGNCVKTLKEGTDSIIDTAIPVDNSSVMISGDVLYLDLSSTKTSERTINDLGTTRVDVFNIIIDTISANVTIIGPGLMIESEERGNLKAAEELFHNMVIYFNDLKAKGHKYSEYTRVLALISIRNFPDINQTGCPGGEVIVETNASLTQNDTFYLPSRGITVYEKNCNWQLRFNTSLGVYADLVATCLIDGPPNMNCSMVAYELYEVVLNNDSVSILDTNVIIHQSDYTVFKNQVFICSNAVTDFEHVVNVFAYSSTHRILSIVTSSVSVVSVAIIIIFHGCLKRLRNIHGLNLTALSVSLLFLHMLLIVQPLIIVGVPCIIYAIALHFLLLNNFAWMNIIGYDMTRIFRRDIVVSQSSPFKRFIGYAMISVTLPTLVIVSCSSLEFTGSSFKPSYGGNDVCWLSNGKGLIAFVIAPVVLSLLLNVCFFTFTVVAIQMKTKETKFARPSGNRAYFIVYLKLTIILGFTWIVGIIGAFVRQEWLWILHLMLNGLQGVSLLICSVVNARNVRHLRTSVKLSTGTASSHVALSES